MHDYLAAHEAAARTTAALDRATQARLRAASGEDARGRAVAALVVAADWLRAREQRRRVVAGDHVATTPRDELVRAA